MKRANGSARAVRLSAVVREHQRRAAIALDHARRGNADDSAMPALAVDDHAVRITEFGFFLEALADGLQDSAFFFLALGIELIEPAGDFFRTRPIFHAEEFDHVSG